MKKIIFLILLLTLLIPNIAWAENPPNDEEIPVDYSKGQVVDILEEDYGQELGAGIKQDYQKLKVEIIAGEHKGQILEIENTTTDNPAFDFWLKKGDKVLLRLEMMDDNISNGFIVDYQRDTYIYWLIGLFFLLLIVIGRKQGFKSVVTLIITVAIVAKFTLPLLFKGHNPVLLALLTGVMVTAITLIIVCGFSKKTYAAIIGTTGGLAVASIIAIIVGNLSNLKGFSSQEAQMLLYIPQAVDFDFRGILFAGIIIGALGAVMDVSMSIASSMDEINSVSEKKLKLKELIKSGMNVGKDIMGTMSNTLILAYTGTSIPLLLLFMAYDQPFLKLINLEFLASECIRALSGSIAVVLAIPFTAIVAGFLMHKD